MRSIGNGSPVGHRLAAGFLNEMRPQLTQFVGHDVINKNTTDLHRAGWLYAVQLGQLS